MQDTGIAHTEKKNYTEGRYQLSCPMSLRTNFQNRSAPLMIVKRENAGLEMSRSKPRIESFKIAIQIDKGKLEITWVAVLVAIRNA